MNRRELVRAAIAHEETPVVPYAIDFTADAVALLSEAMDVDDVGAWVDNDVQTIGVPWWRWHELGPEWSGTDPPTTRPTVIGTGSYDNLADNVKAARDASDKYFLVRIYGSHFEKAYFARGFENLLADIGAEPDFARRLHETIVEKNLVMLENVLALEEIDGVLLGSDWGSQRGPLISPDVWDEMIRPGEQREYDLIHACGKDVWVHSCGDIAPLVPRLVEMGLDVLNPVQPEAMDVAALKENHGAELTFWGGVSTQQTLPYGTPEDVAAEARRVRDLLRRGGGYIFSPAQSIQGDVPVENILALVEVAREGR